MIEILQDMMYNIIMTMERLLDELINKDVIVEFFLKNGSKVSGIVKSYDDKFIKLHNTRINLTTIIDRDSISYISFKENSKK